MKKENLDKLRMRERIQNMFVNIADFHIVFNLFKENAVILQDLICYCFMNLTKKQEQ